ncbi:MAG: hypothetical protein HY444_08860 [Nitrospirae bacterium]|nr:hypothetical protein [Nitrospirota bacterium]
MAGTVKGFFDYKTNTIYCTKDNFDVCGHELFHAIMGRFHEERQGQRLLPSPVSPLVAPSAEEPVGACARSQEHGDPEHRLLVTAHSRLSLADLQGAHQ